MCGILGGNIRQGLYRKGIEAIRHRGPDGIRIESFTDCTLAFARLAIIDLNERAMQPMHSADGSVWIVFNGEIYGYHKVKKELQRKHQFITESDTEVVLNAYMEYGDDFIDYIDGMFAIAIFDMRTREIKLFRDRAGIKPLYYFYSGKDFLFASELKAIKNTLGDDMLQMDRTALYDFAFYEYIPSPKTMYKNCYKLPPAYRLTYSLEEHRIVLYEKYWKLHVNTRSGRKRKKQDIEEAVRYYIKKSVSEQMVADVPVGTYLSGGIDSSIISYHCHEVDKDIRAFSIGFQDKRMDESFYAEMMKDKYNIRFINCKLVRNDIQNVMGMMEKWYDEPFADVSAYPTYLLSKMAKGNVSVVLTGDGGDELFGGYPSCSLLKKYAKNKHLDHLSDRFFALRMKYHKQIDTDMIFNDHSGLALFISSRCAANHTELKKLAEQWNIPKDYDVLWNLKRYYISELPPMTRSRYLDFKTYMPDDVLTKVDRVSMAVSLEARIPFLSRELIEYVFSLSEEECNSGFELKGLLKEAYENIIPAEILYRQKQGFNVPQSYVGNPRKTNSMNILHKEWGLI